MVIRNILWLVFVLPLFISCGNQNDNNREENDSSLFPISTISLPNTLAEIKLKGIICEVDCLSELKNLLSNMVGICDVKIENGAVTEEKRAIVKFDQTKIDDQDLVDAIEKMSEGQLKVDHIALKKIEDKNCHKKKKEEREYTSVKSGGNDRALPSILDVFSTVL